MFEIKYNTETTNTLLSQLINREIERLEDRLSNNGFSPIKEETKDTLQHLAFLLRYLKENKLTEIDEYLRNAIDDRNKQYEEVFNSNKDF